MMTRKGGSTLRRTMINKFKEPGMTDAQAEAAWKADMREKGRKGGKNGKGHLFGHGKVDPRLAGQKGRGVRWSKNV